MPAKATALSSLPKPGKSPLLARFRGASADRVDAATSSGGRLARRAIVPNGSQAASPHSPLASVEVASPFRKAQRPSAGSFSLDDEDDDEGGHGDGDDNKSGGDEPISL
jgi:hypothetical protein